LDVLVLQRAQRARIDTAGSIIAAAHFSAIDVDVAIFLLAAEVAAGISRADSIDKIEQESRVVGVVETNTLRGSCKNEKREEGD
jgi:hypothetical protein